nr:hypothetical protein GCM10020093_053720 [Planobispora longispora]
MSLSDLQPVPADQLTFRMPPTFATVEEERRHRKERLTAALRLFGRFGFEEGVAGHITARDPEHTDHFWVNPFGMSFKQIKVSDLILVNHEGQVVEGRYHVNQAAFAIHAMVHQARPDAVAAAHSHSVYGKALSSLGTTLEPLTQDACAFYEDHGLFDDYTGVVLETEEGGASPRRSARTRPSSCATTACSPWATASTPPPGGSSPWSAAARPSCWPRPPAPPSRSSTRTPSSPTGRSATTSSAGSTSSPCTTRSPPPTRTCSTRSGLFHQKGRLSLKGACPVNRL